MPACLGVTVLDVGGGPVQVAVPVPLAPGAACPGFVVLAPSEYDQIMAASAGGGSAGGGGFFNVTPADAGIYSGAVVMVWATAFAFKAFGRVLNTDRGE